MKRTPILLLALSLQAALPLRAQAPASAAPSRGELLYATHCIACHTTQVHWRDRRLVTDFASLVVQVGRWQKITGLDWGSEEILDVVRYLNTTIYRFPDPAPRQQG
jgi:mono/diheme cytochrome c family protein